MTEKTQKGYFIIIYKCLYNGMIGIDVSKSYLGHVAMMNDISPTAVRLEHTIHIASKYNGTQLLKSVAEHLHHGIWYKNNPAMNTILTRLKADFPLEK